MRCERLKRGGFSLHSEGRAIDWHLDARVATGAPRGDAPDPHPARNRPQRQPPRARPPDGRPGPDLRLPGVVGGDGADRRVQLLLSRETASCATTSTAPPAHRDHVHIELNWNGRSRADLVLAQPGGPMTASARDRAPAARARRRAARAAATAVAAKPARCRAPSSARCSARRPAAASSSIPGFPGEKIDRRLLSDISWIVKRYQIFITDGYSMDDVHSRERRAPARPGARHRPQQGRRRHLERHRPPRPLGRAAPEPPAHAVSLGRLRRRRQPRPRPPPAPLLEPLGDQARAARRASLHGALPGRATSAADGRGARGRSAHRRYRGPQRRRLAEAAARAAGGRDRRRRRQRLGHPKTVANLGPWRAPGQSRGWSRRSASAASRTRAASAARWCSSASRRATWPNASASAAGRSRRS